MNHENVCIKLKTNCPFCDICLRKIEYSEHLDVCKKRSFICDKCNKVVLFEFKSSHDDYYCKEFIEMKDDMNLLIDILK